MENNKIRNTKIIEKTTSWNEHQEELLIAWGEKASGYAWLHNQSASHFRNRNKYISIPSALFSYAAGSSAFLLTDEIDLSTLKTFIGIMSIIAGILTTFQEIFTYKEETERHHIATLRFLSFFRDISSELSLPSYSRTSATEYITLKRIEFDRMLEQSPVIPVFMIDRFNDKFGDLEVHKPDVVNGLQTISPNRNSNNIAKHGIESIYSMNGILNEKKPRIEISNRPMDLKSCIIPMQNIEKLFKYNFSKSEENKESQEKKE